MTRGRKNPGYLGLAQRVLQARQRAGFTQAGLSEAAGLATNAVFHLEGAGRVPGIDIIEKLAGALSVSPGWLAYGEAAAAPSPLPNSLRHEGLRGRLHTERARQTLTYRELAAAAGLSASSVQHIEVGRRVPNLQTVERLATALSVSSAWLAFGIGPQAVPSRRGSRQVEPAADSDL